MKRFHLFRYVAIVLCVLLVVTGECDQARASATDTPQKEQAGLNAPYVPTPQKFVETMLDMANVAASDYVIDLGSGDGRIVITAAKRGATALGIEYNPDLVEFARHAAAKERVSARATFEKADIFESDFSKATVLTLFLGQNLNLALRPKILGLKPGTRVVSYRFGMGDWKPDRTRRLEDDSTGWSATYLWIVPAKVDGTWQLDNGQITFTQAFQNITGKLTIREKKLELSGKLAGDRISFTAGGREYTGTVSGNTIAGTHGGGDAWKATR